MSTTNSPFHLDGAQSKTSERRRGWETSFKSTLLLVAEGVISTFFDGYWRDGMALFYVSPVVTYCASIRLLP